MAYQWLHLSENTVGPRYFVDESGRPVELFGMARCQFHCVYENNLFTETSDPEGLIRHYTEPGYNFIRLAIAFDQELEQGDLVERCGGYNPAGINRFIDEFVDPDVQAILKTGAYIMLDQHNYIPHELCDTVDHALAYAYEHFQPVMIEIAKRYKDEPGIAVMEQWNEPFPADQEKLAIFGEEWNAAVREYFIDTTAKMRQYDTRHVFMVSDYNAGWGCATEATWKGHFDRLDPDYRNTCFSIHLAYEHVTTSLEWYRDTLKRMSDEFNICLLFGEIETEPGLMFPEALQNLFDFMNETKDTFHFSGCLWRVHEDPTTFRPVWEPFVKEYATVF